MSDPRADLDAARAHRGRPRLGVLKWLFATVEIPRISVIGAALMWVAVVAQFVKDAFF